MNKYLVRGLGFFNDAYDLFVMNIVNVVLTEQYTKHVYTSYVKSWVSAAAIIGAVIGQLLFGFLGDVFGRRVNMIATCVLLIVGSILCTVAYGGSGSATLWFLVGARIILGIGIGGEYPLAASSSAEDSTTSAERNTRVATTFSLQGVGQVVAAILGNLLVEALADGKPGENSDSRLETVWRLLFAIGCIPAAVICYYRITAEETEAYKAMQERSAAVTRVGAEKKARLSFILRHYWVNLLGTAGTWFLFDIIYYAQNLFSASILSVIGVKNSSLQQVTTMNAFVALLALPGYYVAIYFINRLGRKKMALQGFFFMGVLCLILAIFWDDLQDQTVLFIVLYGLTLFFANFGPNTATFVLPTEMYPTPIRSTCHGISAAAGKGGAAIGSFGFSIWVENESFGYDGAFYTFCAIAFVSIPLTWFCVFDNNVPIEEMDAEFLPVFWKCVKMEGRPPNQARAPYASLLSMVEAAGLANPRFVVEQLEADHGVTTVPELVEVLEDPEVSKSIKSLWRLRLSKCAGIVSTTRESNAPLSPPARGPQAPLGGVKGRVLSRWKPGGDDGIEIVVMQGDLTECKTDAIVNAANSDLVHGGGVAGAISRKGGRVVQDESSAWIKANGRLAVGSAMFTGGGRLPARYVVHTVGPSLGNSSQPTPAQTEQLGSAVQSALLVGGRLGISSIALPGISTGIFGYPLDRAARDILRES
ncbi:putative inorganic phosphate transporter [Phytophthora cinnamomi]|uniref:putative inorganic phosphate transporter n=1 Tax=Phytophthora cinnamomi TaxID=4785 RepID=UPI00355A8FAC|nr:putative inorganic phosphate transporter [Phytophthora cinnamomi]